MTPSDQDLRSGAASAIIETRHGAVACWRFAPDPAQGDARPLGEQPPGGHRLVVVLHGDNCDPPPIYHARFAATMAAQHQCHAVAVIRPGFAVGPRLRTDGHRGSGHGDAYSLDAAAMLVEATQAIAAGLGYPRLCLVGHSGGGVLAMMAAALAPASLIEDVVLVSCPYDVAEWRRHMARQQLNPFWLLPTPIMARARLLRGLRAARVRCLHGANDRVVPVRIARQFASDAAMCGIDAELTVVEAAGHDLLGHPATAALMGELLAAGSTVARS